MLVLFWHNQRSESLAQTMKAQTFCFEGKILLLLDVILRDFIGHFYEPNLRKMPQNNHIVVETIYINIPIPLQFHIYEKLNHCKHSESVTKY